jgi:hypothetical protein
MDKSPVVRRNASSFAAVGFGLQSHSLCVLAEEGIE